MIIMIDVMSPEFLSVSEHHLGPAAACAAAASAAAACVLIRCQV